MWFVVLKVNSSGIDTEDRKIAANNRCQVLASTAQLLSFRGLAGYQRRFGYKFAHRTPKLYTLTPDKRAFEWFQKRQAEFNNIRRALASALVVALCDPERNLIMHTDAPDWPTGGGLAQTQPCRLERLLVERPLLGFHSSKSITSKHATLRTTASYWLSKAM